MQRASEAVEALLDGDDVRIVFVGACHGGWDDCLILECGKTKATIMITVHGHPTYRDVTAQTRDILPFLRKREAERLADEAIIDGTMARFYR